jgi:hypothetical protein
VDWATLTGTAAIVFGAIGLQTFWISRELDGVKGSVKDGLGRLEARLDRIEGALLALDRRVTRLEERIS